MKGIYTSHGFASNQAKFCCALVRHNDDKTFLPSLQRLSWAQDRKCGLHLLALLAPPTLHTLWLRYRYGSNAEPEGSNIDSDFFAKPDEGQVRATENVLSSMAARCPSLHTLYIGNSFISVSSLLPELLLFRKLRNLDCATSCWPSSVLYTHSDLRILTQTLHPRELAVNIGEFHGGQTSGNVMDCPDLQDLSCAGMSADVARVAACLRAPVLTVFRATIFDEDTMQPSDLLDFFLAASTRFLSSLRGLSFSAQCGTTSNVHPALELVGSISFSDVLPSGPGLSHIEDLHLQFTPGAFLLSFTDEDALALARVMPCIRNLTLNCLCLESRIPSPLALHHFAKHCPRLRVLHLDALEGSPIPVFTAIPAPALEELYLWRAKSAVTEPGALAIILDVLFPNMVTCILPCALMRGDSSEEGWKAVSKELASLRLQRKEHVVDPGVGARVCDF